MSEGDNQSADRAGGGTAPVIPDHVLLRRIGKGSYGEIWLARCALGVYRAVKVVRREAFTKPHPYESEFAGIRRFEPVSREHESLVDILQVGRNDEAGFFYYVMELADDAAEGSGRATQRPSNGKGISPQRSNTPSLRHPESYVPRTLGHEIRVRGRLPVGEVLRMTVGLAEGLDYLHTKGLVHRDIKPSNIIFVGRQPKLADVGMVAELGEHQSLVGTLGFMPPEGPGTVQADLYSLGKVIYEALTGMDRQEFPDLPTQLGSDGEESSFLEVNEVVLKACAKEPSNRYQSAGEMLADLRLLLDGKSLRLARARRQRVRYACTAGALILGVGLVAGLVWGITRSTSVAHTPPQPEVLMSDDFQGPKLNTNLWSWATNAWDAPEHPGHQQCRVEQTNGELVIEAEAQAEGGWTTYGAAWVDSKNDFREFGECRVEVEVSGTNRFGVSALSISDGRPPLDAEDPSSARLLRMPGTHEQVPYGASAPVVHERVGFDLLPGCQAAVVYPDARILDEFEIVDLARVSHWRLRFYSLADSSAVHPDGIGTLRVKRITVTKALPSKTIVGHVCNALTKSPVGEAIIHDQSGTRVAKTSASGAFKLTADAWPTRIRAEHVDFSASGWLAISNDATMRGPVILELHAANYRVGDVVAVIPYTNERCTIGFRGTNLWALAHEGQGQVAQSSLLQVDLNEKRLLSPAFRFPTGYHPLSFIAQCEERLLAVGAWPGAIYDLTSGRPSKILEPKDPADGRRIQWPVDCAYDGEFLWFVEADATTHWFGLRALDLGSLQIKHSVRSSDTEIRGLAWDGDHQQFWISTFGGRFYAVSRDRVLREGITESGRGREFSGHYAGLAYSGDYLWGLDGSKRRICKIKIRD